MNEHMIQVPTAAGHMPAFSTYPEQGGPFPAVVMYSDFWGAREELYDIARWLATVGFYCTVPDIYYRQGVVRNEIHDEAGRMVSLTRLDKSTQERVLSPLAKLSDLEVLEDTGALLQFLGNEPAVSAGPKGCFGFCLGGRLAIRAASRFPDQFKATASLHGSALVTDQEDSPHRSLGLIRGALYCGFAEFDPYTASSTIETIAAAMKGSKAHYAYAVHKGAEHGYALPKRDIYNRRASLRDCEMILSMFRAQLGPHEN